MAKSRTKKPTSKGSKTKAEAKTKKKTWKPPLTVGLEVLAVVVLLVGVGISLAQWHSNRVANDKAARLVSEANQNINHSVPSTIKPTISAFAAYTVAPTLPRYIFIPKLGVKAIVRTLGLTTGNQLAAPDNVYDTGWYNGSSKPGQPGAMVIDGHVSSWTAKGVFYSLNTLKKGDQIQIERGDNSIVNYSVVSSTTYSNTQVNMSALLNPVNPSLPGLNLITCTGEVIKGTNEFNQRVVVFAEQTT